MMRFLWWVPSLSLVLMSPVLAQDPIFIGVSLPLTGNLGAAGRLMLEGVRAAQAVRSQALNRPVELKVADTRSDMAEAANAVFRLVEKEHVRAVICATVSETTHSAYFHAGKRGIPLVAPTATCPRVMCEKGEALRVYPIDEDQGVHASNLALNRLQARTAAIIYDLSDEHSIALATGFKREFTRAGGSILLQARTKTGDRDFLSQINQIRTTKPDVIYAPLYYVECALLARQARNMGVDATVIAGDAVHVQELIEFGGKSVEDLIFTTYFHQSMVQTAVGKRFRDLCMKQTGRQLHAAQVMGADSYLLILEAITKAGTAEPIAIREALCSLSCFDGVTGKISIEKGGRATRPVVITEVIDGNFVEFETGSTMPSMAPNLGKGALSIDGKAKVLYGRTRR